MDRYGTCCAVTEKRTLVCGFGNPYRRDDGVGRVVVNTLRQLMGRQPLHPLSDGVEDLGHQVDTIALQQLLPELAEVLADYDLVIFVDAHVDHLREMLHEERVEAAYQMPFVSHQTHPATLLELARSMGGHAPGGMLLSLCGHDFEFGEGLSTQTAALVSLAVVRILALMEANPVPQKNYSQPW